MAISVNTTAFPPNFVPFLPSNHCRRFALAFPSGSPPSPTIDVALRFQSRRLFPTVASAPPEMDVIPLQSEDSTDHQVGVVADVDSEQGSDESSAQVGGLAVQIDSLGRSLGFSSILGEGDAGSTVDRAINAGIVLAAGTFAITKMLTIDKDYWHGWTLFEILRYLPEHNWSAYEEALRAHPVLSKMMISGVVYSIGDWIAQCYEGKPLFDFDRTRVFRSGLVGFLLHGSLSHYYYHLCEAIFPSNGWWVLPAKVAFDQTLWSAVWNSIYYVVLGLLRSESPEMILKELKATFWPMLTAGWKLWPFAHLITYSVIPVEQRLLWVDCIELIWVTILSTYSNEKSEARLAEPTTESFAEAKGVLVEEKEK